MIGQGLRIIFAVTLCTSSAVSACKSSVAVESSATSISVSVGPSASRVLMLTKGETVQLTVVTRDAAGAAVRPLSEVGFVSRDAATATVSASGAVIGKRLGSTYVVASMLTGGRTLSDSIQVFVTTGT